MQVEGEESGLRGARLRVAIATSGRFHMLDLARELDGLGVDIRFYSYVPRKRAEAFGLARRCHVALLPFLFPLVATERFCPRLFPAAVERLMSWALDALVILRMRRCDVFICMSGMYLLAPKFARWRYGAKVILHRGSRHIVSQAEIMARVQGANQVTRFIMDREIQGYEMADRIAVPSTQVAESFSDWPEQAAKLFLSPYGVNLDEFALRTGPLPSVPTLLFVGQWSYRKGVDVLTKAVESLDGVQFVHVGALLDASFPRHPRFVHHEPVPQGQLEKFYHQAHVFVLASREEGLALVQCQALASGLLLVCTDRTGGADLARFPGLARLIRVVPADDVAALRDALIRALDDAAGKTAVAPITEAERQNLSWRAYARRHLEELVSLRCSGRTNAS